MKFLSAIYARIKEWQQKKCNEQEPTEHHQQPSGHHKEEGTSVCSIRIETLPDDSDWRTEQRNFRSRQIRTAKWLNGITAFAGAVGLLGLFFLWGTLKVTRETANAAKSSADAVQTQAAIAKQTMELGMRAWVFPSFSDTKLECAPNPQLDSCLIFVGLGFQNFGKSPAFNVGHTAQWTWEPGSFPACRAGTSIAPPDVVQTHTFMPVPKVLNRATATAIEQSTQRIYVGGCITYDDPVNKDRTTEWCARYDPVTKDLVICDKETDGWPGVVLK